MTISPTSLLPCSKRIDVPFDQAKSAEGCLGGFELAALLVAQFRLLGGDLPPELLGCQELDGDGMLEVQVPLLLHEPDQLGHSRVPRIGMGGTGASDHHHPNGGTDNEGGHTGQEQPQGSSASPRWWQVDALRGRWGSSHERTLLSRLVARIRLQWGACSAW
jgi:hypothetical protein